MSYIFAACGKEGHGKERITGYYWSIFVRPVVPRATGDGIIKAIMMSPNSLSLHSYGALHKIDSTTGWIAAMRRGVSWVDEGGRRIGWEGRRQ